LIRQVVAAYPESFLGLPTEFVVEGEWRDGTKGLKTAVRSHAYSLGVKPAHFESTRCVFARPDHRCMLQLAAVALGRHKWLFKPTACWLFPLKMGPNGLIPPPGPDGADPDRIDDEYPGYVTFTPCGRHDDTAPPWWETLAEEVAFFESAPCIPLSAGYPSLEDLLRLEIHVKSRP